MRFVIFNISMGQAIQFTYSLNQSVYNIPSWLIMTSLIIYYVKPHSREKNPVETPNETCMHMNINGNDLDLFIYLFFALFSLVVERAPKQN